MFAKVRDNPQFIRDMTNTAILNQDASGLEGYKKKKAAANMINKLQDDMAEVKTDMLEIKQLLADLIKKA